MSPGGSPVRGEVTQLLLSWTRGDPSALDHLMLLVYPELRRLAAACLRRERHDHTLQPTALVHELYLLLVDQDAVACTGRAHFLGVAAHMMRQFLVSHAQRHNAAKRGGGARFTLTETVHAPPSLPLDLIAVDRALRKLENLEPRQGRIGELRFFGGLTEDETAAVLGVAAITVKRDWRIAKAMLYSELAGSPLP